MRLTRFALAFGAILGFASPVGATTVTVTYGGPYQNGAGGEFTVTVTGGFLDVSDYANTTSDGISQFQTFCIERFQFLGGNGVSYNASPSTAAVNGGADNQNLNPGNDPISVGTGWLYSRFAQGTLARYDFDNNNLPSPERHGDAGRLQNAFWMLEDELTPWDPNNEFIDLLLDNGFTQATAQADGGWVHGVYALNLTPLSGGASQDQLYFSVPDGGMTLGLLGFALSAVGVVTRRRRRAN